MADVFLVSVIPTEVEGSFLHCVIDACMAKQKRRLRASFGGRFALAVSLFACVISRLSSK